MPEPVRALSAEHFAPHEGANDGAMAKRGGVRAGAASWLAPTAPAWGQELSVPAPRFEGLRLRVFCLIPKPVDFAFRPNEEVTAAFVLNLLSAALMFCLRYRVVLCSGETPPQLARVKP